MMPSSASRWTELSKAGTPPPSGSLEFQECTLAGPVAADDPDDLALADIEGHVFESPECLLLLPAITPGVPEAIDDRLSEIGLRFRFVGGDIRLAQPLQVSTPN
jgi:hypothetical protein